MTHIDIVGEHQPVTLGVGRAASESLKVDGVVIEKPRVYQQVFPIADSTQLAEVSSQASRRRSLDAERGRRSPEGRARRGYHDRNA